MWCDVMLCVCMCVCVCAFCVVCVGRTFWLWGMVASMRPSQSKGSFAAGRWRTQRCVCVCFVCMFVFNYADLCILTAPWENILFSLWCDFCFLFNHSSQPTRGKHSTFLQLSCDITVARTAKRQKINCFTPAMQAGLYNGIINIYNCRKTSHEETVSSRYSHPHPKCTVHRIRNVWLSVELTDRRGRPMSPKIHK